jgi:hypothetical protein
MTYLQLINRVLTRLREKSVLGVTSSTKYTELIGQMVNEAKYDVEDAGPWYALRTTVTGSMTASVATVDLTASTNERSYLLRDSHTGGPQAWITTAQKLNSLAVITQTQMNQMRTLTDQPETEQQPVYVSFTTSASGVTAEFYPKPDQAYTYKFVFVVPQADLEAKTDVLTIPAEPVWREALVRAIEERGDEFSGDINGYRGRSEAALNRAIMSDFGKDPITFREV